MWKYILKRLLIALPMLLGIALLTFVLMSLTPGNFLDSLKLDPTISQDTIARYEKLYHLDRPAWQQFVFWLGNLFRGELGYSFYYNIPVKDIIGGRLFNTFLLSLVSFLITWLIAIPLGIFAALHRNQRVDRGIQIASYFFLSMPSFFVAMIFLFLAMKTGWLPLGGMTSPHFDDLLWWEKVVDVARHLVIPALALSLGSIAALQRIMRGNLLDVLGQQYVMAARAKGLSENRVVYIHALRNAINPLITLLGYEFSALLSGAALIEIICSWPGIGSLMLTAVRAKDIYLVLASMMMGGVLFIIGNLIADILLAKADPRIHYDETSA